MIVTPDTDFPNRLFRNIFTLTGGSLSLEEEETMKDALDDVVGFTYYDGEGKEELTLYTRLPLDDTRSESFFTSLGNGRILTVISEF